MSLSLNQGTKPEGLEVKSRSITDDTIVIGDYEISMRDFLAAAYYALTNTNLKSAEDPRLQFVKCVASMMVVEGFPVTIMGKELQTLRLHTDIPPAP